MNDDALGGRWAAGTKLGARCVAFEVELDGDGGRIDVPLEGISAEPLASLARSRGALRFSFRVSGRILSFDGQVDARGISGLLRASGEHAAVRLVPVGTAHSAAARALPGVYELDAGWPLSISLLGDLGRLSAVDGKTGEVRALFARPDREDEFFAGPSVLFPEPTAWELTFSNGGTTLRLRRDGDDRLARRVTLRPQELRFSSDGANLVGTLTLPAHGERHPAVVLTHTSARQTRDYNREWANQFAYRGVATLAYDKRGCGESSGDLERASLGDLAADAVAGMRALAAHPAIDSERIGFFGASQGGWIAPLAAATAPNAAFVIVIAAPAVSPEEQETYRVEHQLRAEGFGEPEVRGARALMALKFRVPRENTGWGELDSAVEHARDTRWFRYCGGMPRREDTPGWRAFFEHDAVSVLRRVPCPLLALFGARDHYVPVDQSVATFAALVESRALDATVHVFEAADHSLLESEGTSATFACVRRHVPSMLPTLFEWLRQVL